MVPIIYIDNYIQLFKKHSQNLVKGFVNFKTCVTLFLIQGVITGKVLQNLTHKGTLAVLLQHLTLS